MLECLILFLIYKSESFHDEWTAKLILKATELAFEKMVLKPRKGIINSQKIYNKQGDVFLFKF